MPQHAKITLPKNETTVNLKSASFVVIMLLHEGLTHMHSQINPRLLFGESFILTDFLFIVVMVTGDKYT